MVKVTIECRCGREFRFPAAQVWHVQVEGCPAQPELREPRRAS